ncbi:MAG: adenosylcobinamide-GDP ribazoletransferase [Pseudomonadota bacterium]
MKQRALNELAIFALAVQFLTRLPIPVGNAFTPERLTAAARYYPLVGALVGALCALVYLLAESSLTPTVAVILALGAGLLITGGFHEDGLADTFDGLGGIEREQSLEIMRDSRIGTYGTLALVMVLAAKAAALSALSSQLVVIAFVVAHGLSRLSAVAVIATGHYVRDHGIGKPTAAGIDKTGLLVAGGTGLLLLAWLTVATEITAAVYALVAVLVGHVFMRALFERRLGGYTGDTLGAVQQLSELSLYLGLLLWQSS